MKLFIEDAHYWIKKGNSHSTTMNEVKSKASKEFRNIMYDMNLEIPEFEVYTVALVYTKDGVKGITICQHGNEEDRTYLSTLVSKVEKAFPQYEVIVDDYSTIMKAYEEEIFN